MSSSTLAAGVSSGVETPQWIRFPHAVHLTTPLGSSESTKEVTPHAGQMIRMIVLNKRTSVIERR
jgi:hypothetical protein